MKRGVYSDWVLPASVWLYRQQGKIAGAGGLLMLGFGVADAATIGDAFQHMGGQASTVAKGLVNIFYASGFAASGNGIWKLITRKSRNEGVGEGLTWVAGGAGVAAIGKIMSTAFESMLSDAGGTSFDPGSL